MIHETTLANLRKIAEELPILAKSNPRIISDFDMVVFGVFDNRSQAEVLSHKCSTNGCLLGNAALLFDLSDPKLYDREDGFDYYRFEDKYLPGISDEKWDFLFSSRWTRHEPTFEQAIKRIEFFISVNGEVEGFDFHTSAKYNYGLEVKNG